MSNQPLAIKPQELNPSMVQPEERNRLSAVERYDVLETPAEPSFDRVATMAATLLEGAGAMITFVGLDRVWLKASSCPCADQSINRGDSVCNLAILQKDITIFEDTYLVPALLQNPYVWGEDSIRFYAGIPLISHDGFALGTLCVLDKKPRTLTEQQQLILRDLAAVVMDELELRLSAKRALKLQQELLNMVVHNLKNPLSGILGLSQLLPEYRQDEEEITEMAGLIANTSEKMLESLNELLQLSKYHGAELPLSQEPVNLVELVRGVVQENAILARQKNQTLTFHEIPPVTLQVDQKRMREVVDNLISNCIKYTPLDGSITASMSIRTGWLRMSFKDNGQGLDEQEIKRVFQRFANISCEPTGNESSTGIGLSIVKTLVELHKGHVWAESPGKNLGSTFIVELPLP